MTELKIIFLCFFLLVSMEPAGAQCPSTGQVVTVRNVSGSSLTQESLPWALNCLVTNSNLNTVRFDIPGVAEIHPNGANPLIVNAAGATIEGINVASGAPVVIDGQNVAGSAPNGLTIAKANVTVQNLIIRNFTASAGGNGILVSAEGALIQNNTLLANRVGIGTSSFGVTTFTITGNIIGASGGMGNTSNGIFIATTPTAGFITNNVVSYSGGVGINAPNGTVKISENSIFCNLGGGITRPAPAVPTITFQTTQEIRGTTVGSGSQQVEVFRHSAAGCANAPCQGKDYVGTAVVTGNTWTLTLDVGDVNPDEEVTATLTTGGVTTSAFSPCKKIVDCTGFTAGSTQTNVKCFGGSDGSATATPNGPGYTFQWNYNGLTTATISNLPAGVYNVTVTDAATGCTATRAVTITQPAALDVDVTIADVLCSGGNTGIATANATGGVSPYTYVWSNGQTQSMAINLGVGNYTVTVTDKNNCTSTQSAAVAQPAVLNVSITATNVSCFNGANGTAKANPAGGVPPYTYAWNNGQTQATATGLAAGNYTVTIADKNNCTVVQGISVTQPAALNLSAVPTPVTVLGNDGRVIAAVSGGTPGFTFLWNTGSANDTLTNLLPGMYTVTVTDSNGCTVSATATVNTFSCSNFQAVISKMDVPCFGQQNGSATVLPGGGTPPFVYAWSDGQSTSTATGLVAGNYSVTVTDQNACVTVQSTAIDQPAPVSLNISVTGETMAGAHDGQAIAVPSGGTPPFNYLWNTGSTAPQLTGLAPGPYSLTATDQHGCIGSATALVQAGAGCTVQPVYAILGPDQVCGNSTFMLQADELDSPDPIVHYRWLLPNGTTVVTAGPTLSVTATSGAFSGEYFVVRDSLGCLSIPVGGADVTVLTVDGLFAGNDTVVCNAGLVKLEAAAPASGTGAWRSLGAATVDNPNQNPTVGRGLQPGPNVFVWQVALGACPQAGTDTVVYFLENKPLAKDDRYTLQHAFDVAVMEVLLNDALAGLSDTVLTQISDPAVGTLELLAATHRFRYTVEEDFRGTVTFQYTVCNPASVCLTPCDTATVTIDVLNLPIVPTGLVVQDGGLNGKLNIRGINGFGRVEITIVDRWGDLVFQESHYDNGQPWLGDYKRTGKYLPGGAYYYYLKAFDGDAQIGETMTGVIHLFTR